MKRTTLRNMKCGIIMTVVILMISVVPVTAQSVTAKDEAPERSRDGDEAQRRKGIKGVWLVTITPRNCTNPWFSHEVVRAAWCLPQTEKEASK